MTIAVHTKHFRFYNINNVFSDVTIRLLDRTVTTLVYFEGHIENTKPLLIAQIHTKTLRL